MKTRKILITIIILLGFVLGLCSCKESNKKKGEAVSFKYGLEKEKDFDGTIYYDDSYFDLESTEYNNSLSTASLGVSMACFYSDEGETPHKNIEDLYLKLGFTDFYINDDFDKPKNMYSVGVAFARKKLGKYTLIASSLRGKGYQKEWGSNVILGNDLEYASGFYDSSTIYLNTLNNYIKENKIKGAIKLWIVGYSRGAAIANIAGGRIDNGSYQLENVTYQKDDLYFYTFETPMGVTFNQDVSPRSDVYNNIHNIINPDDAVSIIFMKDLGFTRFGIDHYLPSLLNDNNYKEDLKKLKNIYDIDKDVFGEYILDQFSYSNSLIKKEDNSQANITFGIYFTEFINVIYNEGIKTRENYVDNVEMGLRDATQEFFKNGIPESPSTVFLSIFNALKESGKLNELLKEIPYAEALIVRAYLKKYEDTLSKYPVTFDSLLMANDLYGFFKVFVEALSKNTYLLGSLLNLKNLMCFGQAHSAVLCFSYLMLLDKNYTDNPIKVDMDGGYYLFEGDTNKTYIVYDSNNNEVARYSNNVANKNSDLIYGKMNNRFVLYLRKDNYKIVTNSINYSIKEFNQKYQDMQDVSFTVASDPLGVSIMI